MNRIIRIAPVVTALTGMLYLLIASVPVPTPSRTANTVIDQQVQLVSMHAVGELVPLPPIETSAHLQSADKLISLPPIDGLAVPSDDDDCDALELRRLRIVELAQAPLAKRLPDVIADEELKLRPLPEIADADGAIERDKAAAFGELELKLPPLPPVQESELGSNQPERLPSILTERNSRVADPQPADVPIRLPATDDARRNLAPDSAPKAVPRYSESSPPSLTPDETNTEPTRLAMVDPINLDGRDMIPLPEVAEVKPSAIDRQRSRDLAARELLAGQYVQQAFLLGNRGAHFSARSEFIEALKLLAASVDMAENSKSHSEALAAGLRALEESDDFVPKRSVVESELDLSILASSHRTPVLEGVDLSEMSMFEARQRYYAFAQECFAKVTDRGRAGSMALYGLGRLESEMDQKNTHSHPAAPFKAMVYHQAALAIESENYMAANELGVLLARFGQYEQARDALAHSVRLHPEATTWRNLATVNERLGDELLARQALSQAESLARAAQQLDVQDKQNGDVRWTSPQEFARQSSRGAIR